jgi:hypothetical protein
LPILGDTYTRLNFKTEKSSQTDNDATVDMWFLGTKHRAQQMRFVTEDSAIDFGANKQFFLYPYGEAEPRGRLSCGDLGMVLDDIIPDTGRFSALSDPRKDASFDKIAYQMGDMLRPLATKHNTSRTYLARDITASQIETETYISELGTRLKVEESQDKTLFTLTSTSLV